MSVTKSKRTVSRNIALALGIISIVLMVISAYFIVADISLQNSYNNLQSQNNQVQAWLEENETLLNQIQANNSNLQVQNANLTGQVNDLTSTLNLEKSTVVINNQTVSQQADNFTVFHFLANGSFGYVSVNVTSSTTDTTYVEVIYSGHIYPSGIYYDTKRTVGTNGTADFPFVVEPVLLSPFMTPLPTFIEVRVGNTDTVGNATETVTVTWYY